jgi:hypothetical protein
MVFTYDLFINYNLYHKALYPNNLYIKYIYHKKVVKIILQINNKLLLAFNVKGYYLSFNSQFFFFGIVFTIDKLNGL